MKNIFLSASIPAEDRNPKYFDSANVGAIHNAVTALATVIVPQARLVWGGHPAITPMIRSTLQLNHTNVQEHVTLYQSDYFKGLFPPDNGEIEDIVITPRGEDKAESLREMRLQMIRDNDYVAAIFIGGMEGVEEEYAMFKEYHPDAQVLPVASTGAAAGMIFNEMEHDSPKPPERLRDDLGYSSLFNDLLKDYID